MTAEDGTVLGENCFIDNWWGCNWFNGFLRRNPKVSYPLAKDLFQTKAVEMVWKGPQLTVWKGPSLCI